MNRKKNMLLAFISGLLLALPWSFPGLFFFIFIAWIPLFLVETESRNHPNSYMVFNYAFLSFLVWNLVSTWWIAQAQWVGAVLIIVLNALFMALVFWLASRIRTRLQAPLFFPLLLLWLGYEHFHQSWELAWPWLNLGNAFATVPGLIQWYEYTGVRGGSLWILLMNLIVWRIYQVAGNRNYPSAIFLATTALLLFTTPFFLSDYLAGRFSEKGETIPVALVQPNLDPYTEKFVPEKQKQHLKEFFQLSDSVCDAETRFLFGPETLIIQQIDEENPKDSPFYRMLLHFQEKHPGLTCLLGVHSYKKTVGKAPPGSRFNRRDKYYFEAFNSTMLQTPDNAPVFYHKTRLVPLFERMPFIKYLGFLGEYSLELGGYSGTYSSHQENAVFAMPDSSISILPIICFESVFGPYCAQRLLPQPGFICMVTNDGWWKNTPGYFHHLHFSRLRAIETRRDLVRVANTGVSAIIDAKGKIVAATPWWEKAVLKKNIRCYSGLTFFAKHGDYLGRLSLFFGILLILYEGVQSFIGTTIKSKK